MDKKELLTNFINSMISNDDASANSALKAYTLQKTKSILGRDQAAVTPVNENHKRFLQLINESEYDISFNGNTVVVNGKPVGKVINDLSDDSPIVFVTADGKEQTFNTVDELFAAIEQKFGQV